MPVRSILAGLLAAGFAVAAEVRFDFEDGLDGWRIVEGSFGAFHCDRAEYHHSGGAYRKHGKFFLSTLESPEGRPDDAYTGVAESPVFRLEAPSLTFMVGGGNHPNTYAAICRLDGTEVKRAQGRCAQEMVDVVWELPELVGQLVFLRLVDGHPGSWGHVTLDDVRFQGRLEAEASAQRGLVRQPILPALRALTPPKPAEPPRQLPSSGNPASLRAAVLDLVATFGERYPLGAAFTAELARLEPGLETGTAAERQAARVAFEALQKRALVANPMVRDHPILFIARRQYKADHHNTETMFQAGTVNTGSFQGGGALRTIDFRDGADGRLQDRHRDRRGTPALAPAPLPHGAVRGGAADLHLRRCRRLSGALGAELLSDGRGGASPPRGSRRAAGTASPARPAGPSSSCHWCATPSLWR